MGWFRKILENLYLVDRSVMDRQKGDRRRAERRWRGPDNDLPRGSADPRRKKERRKGQRRG